MHEPEIDTPREKKLPPVPASCCQSPAASPLSSSLLTHSASLPGCPMAMGTGWDVFLTQQSWLYALNRWTINIRKAAGRLSQLTLQRLSLHGNWMHAWSSLFQSRKEKEGMQAARFHTSTMKTPGKSQIANVKTRDCFWNMGRSSF